jgi:hypothetical protein
LENKSRGQESIMEPLGEALYIAWKKYKSARSLEESNKMISEFIALANEVHVDREGFCSCGHDYWKLGSYLEEEYEEDEE